MGNGAPRQQLSTFWRWNIGLWTVVAVPMFLIRYTMHQDVLKALGLTLFQETLSLLLCGVMHHAYQRVMLRRRDFGLPTAAILIGLSLLATGVQAVAVLLQQLAQRLRFTPCGPLDQPRGRARIAG